MMIEKIVTFNEGGKLNKNYEWCPYCSVNGRRVYHKKGERCPKHTKRVFTEKEIVEVIEEFKKVFGSDITIERVPLIDKAR